MDDVLIDSKRIFLNKNLDGNGIENKKLIKELRDDK